MLKLVVLNCLLAAGWSAEASRILSFALIETWLVLLSLYMIFACHWEDEGVEGPYVAYPEKIYRCPGLDYSGFVVTVDLRPSFFRPHFTTPQTLTGNITVLESFGDETWGTADLDKWSNNNWKENYFVFNLPGGSCSNIRLHVPFMWKMVERDGNQKQPCKINKGVRIYNNIPINATFPYFPIMPYGRWRLRLTGGRIGSKKTLFCMMAEGVTAPNPRA